MASKKSPDLNFVTNIELLDEIQKRMDSMVFVGQASRTEQQDELSAVFKGTLHSCLGLCEVSKLMIISGDIKNAEEEEEPDE